MSADELAQHLKVSRGYAMKLLRKHALRPVVVIRRRRYVSRSKAKTFYRRRQRIALRAMREMTHLSQEAALYGEAQNADMTDSYAYHVDPHVLTTVSVFLGDCGDANLPLMCEGTPTLIDATMWQRVFRALQHPTPRGPFPVASVFTIFVHNTSIADSSVLSTLLVDVACKDGLAYASVQSTQSRYDLEPVPVVIGDDVVTIARKIVASAE